MELELTDDIFYVIYQTYKGDRSMYEDNHFCHPCGVEECSIHTAKEVFDSIQSQKDTEFYAVIDGGYVGFVTFRQDMRHVLNFGMTIASRRAGRAAEFMDLVRKFGHREGVSVRVCSTNKRDILMLRACGFEKGEENGPDHLLMNWAPEFVPRDESEILAELLRLYRMKREIENEKRVALAKFRDQLREVDVNIGKVTKEKTGQLSLF